MRSAVDSAFDLAVDAEVFYRVTQGSCIYSIRKQPAVCLIVEHIDLPFSDYPRLPCNT